MATDDDEKSANHEAQSSDIEPEDETLVGSLKKYLPKQERSSG